MERLDLGRRQARRLLSAREVGRPKNPGKVGRPGKYQDARFKAALRSLWGRLGYMCSRSFHSALPDWLPAIEEQHGSYAPEIWR